MKLQFLFFVALCILAVSSKPARRRGKNVKGGKGAKSGKGGMSKAAFNARMRGMMRKSRTASGPSVRSAIPEAKNEQKQSEFVGGPRKLRSQSQIQSDEYGMSRSQSQSQMMLSKKARAEFQNQEQKQPGVGRQVQSQSQYDLGPKGKKHESSSKNSNKFGDLQNQVQRQSFDTSSFDETSSSLSEEMGGVQMQSQIKGSKFGEEIPMPDFDLTRGQITEGGILVQFQYQANGQSYSYSRLIPFEEIEF